LESWRAFQDKRVALRFFASKLAPTRILQCFDVSAEEKAPHHPIKKCPVSIDTGHFVFCSIGPLVTVR
ncbi:MAG: hypothetical protein ACRESJ_06100, partial [Pseudomonas sp.]|uniref:hypothetical protein n=1 Tax=Pseudomonas sp. TaxID=306 RepID=UPI003D6EE3FF